MSKFLALMLAALVLAACNKPNEKMNNCENESWDKVFPLSEKVSHKKVSFQNQYGFTLVADLYTPKSVSRTVCQQDGLSVKRSVSKAVFRQSRCPVLSAQPKSRARGYMR